MQPLPSPFALVKYARMNEQSTVRSTKYRTSTCTTRQHNSRRTVPVEYGVYEYVVSGAVLVQCNSTGTRAGAAVVSVDSSFWLLCCLSHLPSPRADNFMCVLETNKRPDICTLAPVPDDEEHRQAAERQTRCKLSRQYGCPCTACNTAAANATHAETNAFVNAH